MSRDNTVNVTLSNGKSVDLPLMTLKGKPYMQVAQRIVWLTSDQPRYTVDTELLEVSETMTIAKVTVTILDASGSVIKRASDVKRETKADFSDHTEKAVTGALGRCLASLGYGTAFAIADLDEGNRLADSPVAETKKLASSAKPATAAPAASASEETASETSTSTPAAPAKRGGFSAFKKPGAKAPAQTASSDGFN